MNRRHWIAHRVDRDLMEKIDPTRAQRGQPILPELVIEWKNAVIQIGEAILAKV
jgi:hypothetical protein